jgi:hypothetical protein
MAVTGGALRKYLGDKNELPAASLNAMVPMTTRGAKKDADVGNQVGMSAMPICTDIADPIERLKKVSRGSSKTKQATSSVGKDLPGKLINLLPAVAGKMLITKGLLPLVNLTISNVRGPDVPLYLAGAQMVLFLPVSIPMDNLGLNITGFSYNGTLWICVTVCRQMMPDPAVFAQCYRESFEELLLATKKLTAAAPAKADAKPKAAGSIRAPSTKTVETKPSAVKAKPPAKPASSRPAAKAPVNTAAAKPAPAKVPAAKATDTAAVTKPAAAKAKPPAKPASNRPAAKAPVNTAAAKPAPAKVPAAKATDTAVVTKPAAAKAKPSAKPASSRPAAKAPVNTKAAKPAGAKAPAAKNSDTPAASGPATPTAPARPATKKAPLQPPANRAPLKKVERKPVTKSKNGDAKPGGKASTKKK